MSLIQALEWIGNAVAADCGGTDEQSPLPPLKPGEVPHYEAPSQIAAYDVPGQLDALIAGKHDQSIGCWAVSSTPGSFVTPAKAQMQFFNLNGAFGNPIALPNAGQRSYGGDALSHRDCVAIAYTSSQLYPFYQAGDQHGVYFWCPGKSNDYNLTGRGLTGEGALAAQGDEVAALFNQRVEDPNQNRNRIDFSAHQPSLVRFINPWGGSEEFDITDVPGLPPNASAIYWQEDGKFLIAAAGGNVENSSTNGALAVFNPDTGSVENTVSTPGGIGIGKITRDVSGVFYATGYNPSGYSLVGLKDGSVQMFILPHAFLQSVLPYGDQLLFAATTGEENARQARFQLLNSTVEVADVGEPIPANFSVAPQKFFEDGNKIRLCAGAATTRLNDQGLPVSQIIFLSGERQ